MKNILLPILCCFALLSCDQQKSPEAATQGAPAEQSHAGHNHDAHDGHNHDAHDGHNHAPGESHDGHSHAVPGAHPDDDTGRVKSLIRTLSKTYGESPDSIAERTYRARYVLSDFGIEESAVQILEDMSKAGRKEQKTYREAVLQYTMRRTQGNRGEAAQ